MMRLSHERGVEGYLSTQALSDMARRAVAADNGLTFPVYGDVEWLWSPGIGPVAHVANLVHLPKASRYGGLN